MQYIISVNLGLPGSTTDWLSIGPFATEAAADAVCSDVSQIALSGLITIDRVLVMPLESYDEVCKTGLAERLITIQRGE